MCMTLHLYNPINGQIARGLQNRKSPIVSRFTRISGIDSPMSSNEKPDFVHFRTWGCAYKKCIEINVNKARKTDRKYF
jgi:hypothetical protein